MTTRLVIDGWSAVRLEQVAPTGEVVSARVLDLDELAEGWAVGHGYAIAGVWQRAPRTQWLEIVEKTEATHG